MARESLIELRKDTAADWTSADPTLNSGECGFEEDTGRLKIGDGSTAWISLPYQDQLNFVDVGVEWAYEQTASALTRKNLLGETVAPSIIDWTRHPYFSQIKRCNLADDSTYDDYEVTAWYGDPDFSYTGSNGQVMTWVPKGYSYEQHLPDTSGTSSKYRYYISHKPRPNFRLDPAFIYNETELDGFFIGTFPACAYDVTGTATEVNTIEITAEPTSAGNLTIVLDAHYSFTVAIVDADTIEGVIDKIVAAGVKTDYSGVTWTPLKVDASHVSYTAGSSGLKTTATMATALGVTNTIVKTTSGAGGYVVNDSLGVDYTASSGDKLSSVSGALPLSGKNNATNTMTNMRVLAHNRGSGWELQNYNMVRWLQTCYLVRYADFDIQSKVSEGVTNLASGTGNQAFPSGYTAGVGTGSSDLGNTTGEVATITHPTTSEVTQAFSLFGIENWPTGNIYEWVDGINIKADRNPWIADHGFADDTFTTPYVDTGLTLGATSGYAKGVALDPTKRFGFLPTSVGGSDSTYLTDYYSQSAGNRAALLGGGWPDGAHAGAFNWILNRAASYVHRLIGARLAFLPHN